MKRSIPAPLSFRVLVSTLVAAIMVAPAWAPRSHAEPTGDAIVLDPGTPSPGWAQLYRRGHAGAIPIRLPRSRSASTIGLSPDGLLVAHDLNHTGDPGSPRGSSNYEVVVADSAGQSVATFVGGVRFAWSPEGKRLAVGIACEPYPIPPFDSIVVWEPSRGITLRRRVPASRGLIGWAGVDTLLIGSSARDRQDHTGNTGHIHDNEHRWGPGHSTEHRLRIAPGKAPIPQWPSGNRVPRIV
jgi:hypothetical protein